MGNQPKPDFPPKAQGLQSEALLCPSPFNAMTIMRNNMIAAHKITGCKGRNHQRCFKALANASFAHLDGKKKERPSTKQHHSKNASEQSGQMNLLKPAASLRPKPCALCPCKQVSNTPFDERLRHSLTICLLPCSSLSTGAIGIVCVATSKTTQPYAHNVWTRPPS